MDTLFNELQKKEKELSMLCAQLQEHLQHAPEGKLRISHKRGKPIYYHRTCFKKSDPKSLGKYIRKEDIALAQRLAQKGYEENLLEDIEEQLKAIQKCLQSYDVNALTRAYEKMSQDRKALVKAHILPDDIYAEMWQEEEYSSKGFTANDPEIYTEKNERVRSKSEKILADKFYMKGIPYKYEYPLVLQGYGTVYPDFTILNKRTRKIFYLEHLGMMDDETYAEKAMLKIETYERNGIYPGKQLILTHEMRNRPLNIKIVEGMIEEFLI
ncbi:MAG: hypothetical protein ACI4S2_05615 [Lachnospiraceae bacterium]